MGLAEGYEFAYASLNQIKNAANAIMSKCGADGSLQGGTVSNIGLYNSRVNSDSWMLKVRT